MSDHTTPVERSSVPPSMKCVCGHWDTDHAAFTKNITPGRTRTFCDHCDCRSWVELTAAAAAGGDRRDVEPDGWQENELRLAWGDR